jgi:hypothetical protein
MKKLILLCTLVASLASLRAADAGFQASFTPDLALHDRSTTIHGLSLSIWGENPQHGLALGFVNGSTGVSSGFTWSFIANYSDTYTGVAWGMVNISHEKFTGWQSGFVNVAKEFHGLQWGVINYSENLRGLQLGLINVAENNPWFTEFPHQLATGFPIVNWSF